MEYIIDFERVNELCAHPNDNPKDGISGVFVNSSSRKIIKDYLDIYTDSVLHHRKVPVKYTQEMLNHVIETLNFNRILISKADIRDDKISQVLQT